MEKKWVLQVKNSFSTNSLFALHTQQRVQVETVFQLYSIIFYLWPGGRSLRWQKWAEVSP